MGPKLLLLFIVGDILGTGVYALTGEVAAEVGGAAWVPFLVAFGVAMITAFSYLELVTKYPQAAGAALYTHKAFGIHFLTFIVCFTVMCSGITVGLHGVAGLRRRTSRKGFGLDTEQHQPSILGIALGFMALVAAVNFRGVGESVKANVVLTLVELSGLLLVILVGFYAIFAGKRRLLAHVVFDTPERQERLPRRDGRDLAGVLRDGRLRGLGQHGRGDQGPRQDLPQDDAHRASAITGLIYILVLDLRRGASSRSASSATATPRWSTVVETGGARASRSTSCCPFISMFAVANSALINMLMASRLLYGMAQAGGPAAVPRQGAPRPAGRPWVAILFTTALAFGLITYVSNGGSSDVDRGARRHDGAPAAGGLHDRQHRVLVLRKDTVDHDHFVTPTVLPILGAILCAFLVTPADRPRPVDQYQIAGFLLVLGVVLWAITWFANRRAAGQEDLPARPATDGLAAAGPATN